MPDSIQPHVDALDTDIVAAGNCLARLNAGPGPDPDAVMASVANESASAHLADLLTALETLLSL